MCVCEKTDHAVALKHEQCKLWLLGLGHPHHHPALCGSPQALTTLLSWSDSASLSLPHLLTWLSPPLDFCFSLSPCCSSVHVQRPSPAAAMGPTYYFSFSPIALNRLPKNGSDSLSPYAACSVSTPQGQGCLFCPLMYLTCLEQCLHRLRT